MTSRGIHIRLLVTGEWQRRPIDGREDAVALILQRLFHQRADPGIVIDDEPRAGLHGHDRALRLPPPLQVPW